MISAFPKVRTSSDQSSVASSIADAAVRFAWLETVPTEEIPNVLRRLTETAATTSFSHCQHMAAGQDASSITRNRWAVSERQSRSQPTAAASCFANHSTHSANSSSQCRHHHAVIEMDPKMSLVSLRSHLLTFANGGQGVGEARKKPRPFGETKDDISAVPCRVCRHHDESDAKTPKTIVTRRRNSWSSTMTNISDITEMDHLATPAIVASTLSERIHRSTDYQNDTLSERIHRSTDYQNDSLSSAKVATICEKLSSVLAEEICSMDNETLIEAFTTLILSRGGSVSSRRCKSGTCKNANKTPDDGNHGHPRHETHLHDPLLHSPLDGKCLSPKKISLSSGNSVAPVSSTKKKLSTKKLSSGRSSSCSPKLERRSKRLIPREKSLSVSPTTTKQRSTSATNCSSSPSSCDSFAHPASTSTGTCITSKRRDLEPPAFLSVDAKLFARGWKRALDAKTGQYYYYTLDHSQVVWESPCGSSNLPMQPSNQTVTTTRTVDEANSGHSASVDGWGENDSDDLDPFGDDFPIDLQRF